ncbi:MAG: DegT/DnrJ/EryC1/StrS aminotransferase family protein [Treponema sp.]|uniref:DegT/DnrJ/EryC1/StrS family aminotransferase n=1 Tax=Treponema sp. TaxID=166 RepID=UPI001AFF8311|nr:DegT/DnrJ/EryC1/StrS family aminotransferase [Treponema sp.]MBO6218314.1 DegT/DnrJ/EryC1/StrS aminotransferase family protein [Treponema sp.]MBQ8679004.1 DegT/DnrJ/EryC1/StrS aminotransferase family protein [Treponema sp.]
MIQTFSSTIRRKEMDAVLTCMVDEKLGPGELNAKLIQSVKEFTGCDGAVAFRSPAIAFSYVLKALDLQPGSSVMISALAPSWHYTAVKNLGYEPLVLDVNEDDGLLSPEAVEEGIKKGGRLLLLHETMGILPKIEEILSFGIPVIEDISHSVGASYVFSAAEEDSAAKSEDSGKKAGMAGLYSILGLESNDTITAGGGAVLIAPKRREWIVLKKFTDAAPETDILPDMNSALGFIQLKEFARNEQARKALFAIFQKSLMSGKNKTFARDAENGSTIWSFPVVLSGSFKDAKQYASRKEIEIRPAYEKSVIAVLEEMEQANYIHAKSLFLRTVLFPLYPRLGSESATKIAKVLGTLP